MTFLKNLLAAISILGIFAVDAAAQIVRDDHVDTVSLLADPGNMPPQSPAARTSAGAILIRYKVEILDTDGDGVVSRSEVTALNMPELLRVFDRLDRNRDGKLEQQELDRFVK